MQHDQGYFEETKLGKTYDIKLLKRLYPFARPYRLLLFGSIGLVLLITCLDLALPYVTKIAIDRYIVPTTDAIAAGRSSDNSSKERASRKSEYYAGSGLAVGAAIGMIFGLMLFEELALGGTIGAALGLMVGAAIDAYNRR